jgi:hypothetical protein
MYQLATLLSGLLVLGCNSAAGTCTSGPCDGAAARTDLSGAGSGKKRVFATSTAYSGDLKTAGGGSSGRAGADQLCNTVAMVAGLGGRWVAWLSDTTAAIDHVSDVSPWYTTCVDTTVTHCGQGALFATKAELMFDPAGAIMWDESGQPAPGTGVWTGTAAGGSASGQSCQQWSNGTSSSIGTIGSTERYRNGGWTSLQTLGCDSPLHLYCFEQ